MTSAGPPILLWDIGNVLVRWDPRNLYCKMFGPAALDRFLGEVCTMDWHAANDAGVPMADNCAALAAIHPEHAGAIHAFRTRWAEMFDGDIADSVALVEHFAKAGLTQCAITNFPAEKWEEFAATRPWLTHFADIVISGREGMRKPDADFYALAEARITAAAGGPVAPGRIVFIDDNGDNIAAGAARGYDAILFTGPEALTGALAARGLL